MRNIGSEKGRLRNYSSKAFVVLILLYEVSFSFSITIAHINLFFSRIYPIEVNRMINDFLGVHVESDF